MLYLYLYILSHTLQESNHRTRDSTAPDKRYSNLLKTRLFISARETTDSGRFYKNIKGVLFQGNMLEHQGTPLVPHVRIGASGASGGRLLVDGSA